MKMNINSRKTQMLNESMRKKNIVMMMDRVGRGSDMQYEK